jgi:adenylosuccinate synthase
MNVNKKIINVIDMGHGESGKTKIIDYLSNAYSYFFDICCRSGSGTKKSTISFKGYDYSFEQMPSSILNKRTLFFIGGNACVDTESIEKEIKDISAEGRVYISKNANVITDTHKCLETDDIHPLYICYSSDYIHNNSKITQTRNSNYKVVENNFLNNFSRILVEFEEGVLSEIPNPSKYFSSVIKSLSLNINKCVFYNIGVVKSYSFIRQNDGNPSIGSLDVVKLKESCENNSITHLAITKIDTLFRSFTFEVCVKHNQDGTKEYKKFLGDPLFRFKKIKGFSDFSENIRNFICYIEDFTGLPVIIVSYGRSREDTFCIPVFIHE